MALSHRTVNKTVSIETSRYLFELNLEKAQALLTIKGTHQRHLFFPGGACNPVGRRDETLAWGKLKTIADAQTVTLLIPERSTCWRNKINIFICAEKYIEFYYRLEGRGVIARANYFRGYFKGEERGMTSDIDEIYSTCPNFQEKLYFHPGESFVISAGNCLDLPVGCQALASPCDCMGLHDRRDAKYLSVGLAAQPGQYTWDSFQWNPPVAIPVTQYAGDNVLAGAFAAVYDGKLRINGQWESPRLVMTFAGGQDDVLRTYLHHCYQKGYLPGPLRRKPAAWWRGPIYCTWHDQVAMVSARSSRDGTGGTASASDFCTQRLCDRWVKMLERHGCKPGIVILDDAWAVNRNSAEPDPKKWSDMRKWIEQCHARDIHVFLWFTAWSSDGLPVAECITRDGKPVASDISNPAFCARFRETIQRWFSDTPGCLNADGIKVDGLMSLPVGSDLRNAGNVWGLELQKLLLKTLHEEAKRHKPDVCISTYALNPYLAPYTDMVRIGDMYNSRITAHETLKHRAALYKIAMPHTLIDTDGQFSHYSLDDYRSELARQAEIGIPTLYNAEWIYRYRFFQELSVTRVTKADYREFARVFAAYRGKIVHGHKKY